MLVQGEEGSLVEIHLVLATLETLKVAVISLGVMMIVTMMMDGVLEIHLVALEVGQVGLGEVTKVLEEEGVGVVVEDLVGVVNDNGNKFGWR